MKNLPLALPSLQCVSASVRVLRNSLNTVSIMTKFIHQHCFCVSCFIKQVLAVFLPVLFYEAFCLGRQRRYFSIIFKVFIFLLSLEFFRFPVSLVSRKRKAREAVISAYCSAWTASQFLASS